MDIRTKRLRSAFEKSGLTQAELCEIADINKGALSSYLSGRYFPKQQALEKLSSALNVSIPYLMALDIKQETDLSGITNLSYPAAYPVPILGTICAGSGVWCEENYEGVFFLDKSIKADLCLQVKGDSMIEAGIDHRDLAFIKKEYDFQDGKIYAVRINDDNEAVLKSVHIQRDSIVLSPRNSEYPPIIEPIDNVTIVGECVGVYKNIKK